MLMKWYKENGFKDSVFNFTLSNKQVLVTKNPISNSGYLKKNKIQNKPLRYCD